MGKVYINGREAVHKGCGGSAIAFPDVCLCPPARRPARYQFLSPTQCKPKTS